MAIGYDYEMTISHWHLHHQWQELVLLRPHLISAISCPLATIFPLSHCPPMFKYRPDASKYFTSHPTAFPPHTCQHCPVEWHTLPLYYTEAISPLCPRFYRPFLTQQCPQYTSVVYLLLYSTQHCRLSTFEITPDTPPSAFISHSPRWHYSRALSVEGLTSEMFTYFAECSHQLPHPRLSSGLIQSDSSFLPFQLAWKPPGDSVQGTKCDLALIFSRLWHLTCDKCHPNLIFSCENLTPCETWLRTWYFHTQKINVSTNIMFPHGHWVWLCSGLDISILHSERRLNPEVANSSQRQIP